MDTSSAPSAATGTSAKKTLDHENCSSSQPPTIGPTAMPTPVVAPQSPIARARSLRSVKTFVRSDSVAGKINAAPMPMTARAAISSPGELPSPPARLASPNTQRPVSRTPLRPTRSPRLPAARTSAANARL
jgi:hypothetical protein